MVTPDDYLRIWQGQMRQRGIPADAEAVAYAAILLRDPCVYCGTHVGVGIDHITPQSLGGTSAWDNLAACCGSCNSRKIYGSSLRLVHRMLYQRLTGREYEVPMPARYAAARTHYAVKMTPAEVKALLAVPA